MPLATTLAIRLQPALSKVLGGKTLSLTPEFSRALSWLTGVVIDQADKLYYAKPIISGSGTLTLDVNGGGLLDPHGDAFALARLKLLIVNAALADCPNVINVSRPASNGVPFLLAAGDAIPVRPGGGALIWAPDATGYAVTAGTGDLIDIVNTAAGNVAPEIFLIGASA